MAFHSQLALAQQQENIMLSFYFNENLFNNAATIKRRHTFSLSSVAVGPLPTGVARDVPLITIT
jgi:hypothetical protein